PHSCAVGSRIDGAPPLSVEGYVAHGFRPPGAVRALLRPCERRELASEGLGGLEVVAPPAGLSLGAPVFAPLLSPSPAGGVELSLCERRSSSRAKIRLRASGITRSFQSGPKHASFSRSRAAKAFHAVRLNRASSPSSGGCQAAQPMGLATSWTRHRVPSRSGQSKF